MRTGAFGSGDADTSPETRGIEGQAQMERAIQGLNRIIGSPLSNKLTAMLRAPLPPTVEGGISSAPVTPAPQAPSYFPAPPNETAPSPAIGAVRTSRAEREHIADRRFQAEERVASKGKGLEPMAPNSDAIRMAAKGSSSPDDTAVERGAINHGSRAKSTTIAEITIDEEFSTLLPTLSEGARAQLEHDLRSEGCRDPLLVWNDGKRRILLDGHNRLEICRRYALPYHEQTIELPNRDTALIWILEHQLGRRNLTPDTQAYVRGKLYNSYKRQGARTDLTSGQSGQRLTAAERIAAELHVGEKTIRRDAQFAEQLDELARIHGPDVKHRILARTLKIPRGGLGALLKKDKAAQAQILATKPERKRVSEKPKRKRASEKRVSDRRSPRAPVKAAAASVINTRVTSIEERDTRGHKQPSRAAKAIDDASIQSDDEATTGIWALRALAKFLRASAPGTIEPAVVHHFNTLLREVSTALEPHASGLGADYRRRNRNG